MQFNSPVKKTQGFSNQKENVDMAPQKISAFDSWDSPIATIR